MKNGTLYLSILLIFFLKINLCANTAAFGIFPNSTDKSSFDYLEKILPSSIASSLSTLFKFDIIKPSKVEQILKEKLPEIKAPYKQEDLIEICNVLKCDYFIYGYYTPLDKDQINIKLNFYFNNTNEIFSFVQLGKMETEIFKLVDNLSKKIFDLTYDDYYFKNRTIPKDSKIAFITNISGKDLNYFYIPFLKSKYRIASIQNNTLNNQYPLYMFNNFQHITSSGTSIEKAHSKKKLKIKFAHWMSEKKIKDQIAQQKMVTKYYYNFIKEKNNTLDKLSAMHMNNIDYLFIIGFNKNNKKAWLRCINLRSQNMIWLESGINSSGKHDITVMNIAENIKKKFNSLK